MSADAAGGEPGIVEPRPATPGVRWWPPAAALAGIGVLVAALQFGHGVNPAIAGLPDPGRFTAWALPAFRLLVDVSATLTVGLTTTAAFLLPGTGRTVCAAGFRMLRWATVTASGWAAATVVLLVLSASDLLGRPVGRLSGASVISFATTVSQGQALVVQAGLAAVVAAVAGFGLSRVAAAGTALLALVAVLPPAFTGHAAGAGNHQVAVTSLALHIGAAVLWVGGLAALVTLRRTGALAGVATRYSRLALGCWVAVGVSGVANAWVRLGGIDQLGQSRYGVLVLGKLAALVILGGLGAAHRTRTLPALRAGRRWAFSRLAAAELVVFAGTFGLAVALSRSPAPVPDTPVDADPVVEVLGFGMPAPPTALRMIADPLPDLFFLTVTAVGVVAYLAGVRRLHRAGHRWPIGRTVCWLAGMLVLAAVTVLGLARYAYVLFSVHMAQHMVLSMLVPILLVSGAPITLALRALRRPTDPDVRGAREWLLLAVHSQPIKILTHPLVALGLYVVSLYGLYLSNLLGVLMRYHLGHLAMLSHFVVAGYLLFWTLIGVDPDRWHTPPPLRVAVHFAAMAFHGFFGMILMQSRTVIAPDWYRTVHPDWAPSLLSDQHLGAGIAWAFGEIPAVIVFAILIVRWIHADEREQARLDRAAARAEAAGEDDELARYNTFLAQANGRTVPVLDPRHSPSEPG